MDAAAAAHRPAPTEDVAVEPEDIPIVEEELVIAERPHPQNSYRN
jgi:hypothetical protein